MNALPPPKCKVCGTLLRWKDPGISRETNNPYDGFWGCPNRQNHPPKGQPAPTYAQPAAPQAPQPAPAPRPAPAPTSDTREQAISFLACLKASSELHAPLMGSAPAAEVQDLAFAYAVRCYAHGALPVLRGQVPGGTQPGERNPPDDSDIPF